MMHRKWTAKKGGKYWLNAPAQFDIIIHVIKQKKNNKQMSKNIKNKVNRKLKNK